MKNAKIFFGSDAQTKENVNERRSPYNDKVVSTAPICDEADAKKALKIAQLATTRAKASTIAQRCNWLLDVAKKAVEIAIEDGENEAMEYIDANI